MKKSVFLKFKLNLLLVFLFISSTLTFSQTINHWETAIFNSDTWKYQVPASEPATSWRSLTFDDTPWLSGSGGFGYTNNDDGTTIWTQGTKPTSVYMRIKFNVADTSKISAGVFHIDYDDAFVAYLNGIEIARVGITGTFPAYNQLGTDHNAVMFNGGKADAFILDKIKLNSCLNKGLNVLAIEVHNSSVTSSDMSSNAFLSFAIKDASTFFRTTPSWFVSTIAPSLLVTYLPIISISTNGQTIYNEPKITADMKIIHHGGSVLNDINDEPNVYNGKIGIEIRGATSAGYPQTPYGLETRDIIGNNIDTALLGMPSDNDWVLLSNWNENLLPETCYHLKSLLKWGIILPLCNFVKL